MLKVLSIVAACVVSAGCVLTLATPVVAQTRCEPTLANPCKPQPSTTMPNAAANPPQRREPTTRLNESPFQDIQVDRNTSIGLGHGGIIGLERKYDPKEQPWR